MKLHVKNFRSIEDQEIELGPITVIYGPNGAGKSSLLYTLLTLKNVVLNPNQMSSAFFNYPFASLGSFEAIVFDHDAKRPIELGLSFERARASLCYRVTFREKAPSGEGLFTLQMRRGGGLDLDLRLPVAFPYRLNQEAKYTLALNGNSYTVAWNGVTGQTHLTEAVPGAEAQGNELATLINAPVELFRRLSVVPLKRGFSKPHYMPVPLSPLLATEDEVATLLQNEHYLEMKLSTYLEGILGRDLRLHTRPGTVLFSLDVTDKKTGLACELVNEGFGLNQLVYLLALCLRRDTELICVEEPEIHLHPTAIRGLAAAMARIAREEDKRFVISTHSEPLILAFLALVAKGELQPNHLACYLARKEDKRTIFDREHVNEDGQIQGGLSSFMEGELEDVKTFLGLTENQNAAVAR